MDVKCVQTAVAPGGCGGVPRHSVPDGTQAMAQPRVCVLTSSFPEDYADNAGVFVEEQVRRLSMTTSMDIVYPSRQPPQNHTGERFTRYRVQYPFKSRAMSQVRGFECIGAVEVFTHMAVASRSHAPYDLYHAYWAIPSGFVACCTRGRSPLVITLCGSDVNSFGDRHGFRAAVRWALAGATRVIAVSHALLDRAVDLGMDPAKGTVIPSGVDTRLFAPVVEKTCARRYFGFPDGFLCIYVGSLFRSKRVDRLIRAVRRAGEDTHCTLIVVGDGPERESLETMADECGCSVVFMGCLAHSDVAKVVACADAFVMASATEGLPTSAQEAMCCGVPVVAIDVGGLREIVIDGVNGFVARDELELARIVRRLAINCHMATDLGMRALQFARSELDVDACVAKTLEVYRIALDSAEQSQPRGFHRFFFSNRDTA